MIPHARRGYPCASPRVRRTAGPRMVLYLRVFDNHTHTGRRLSIVVLKPTAKPCRRCGAVGPGAPRPAPPRPDFAPCRGASLSKTRARRHDCHYPRHLSLRGRPRLAQGSLWGAVAAPKASNLTLWSAGRATRWAVRDNVPLGSQPGYSAHVRPSCRPGFNPLAREGRDCAIIPRPCIIA